MMVWGQLHDNWVGKGWGAAALGLAAVTELARAHRNTCESCRPHHPAVEPVFGSR